MLKRLKYIIVERGCPSAIIFGDTLTHKEVAGNYKVLSAGFVIFGEKKPKCLGESVSLRISSNPKEDERIIYMQFYHKEGL